MSIPQRFQKISFIFSVIVILTGFFVLIGWAGNISFLKSISPHWISMKVNAAICFLLTGITLILVNHKKKNTAVKNIASLFSGIIFITGAATLLEYIFDFNAGIDELFFKDNGNALANLPPGRLSPTSAAYFMIFGICYLPGTNKWMKTSLFQMLHIVCGIIILASLMSYVLGSYIIAGVSLKFIFVIHSTLSFLFLILAVLFSQPEAGIMKQVSSDSSGGKIIRKTLPLLVFFFIVLGWLRLKGEQAGLYNEELGMSIFIILMIIIMGYLIFSNAVSFTKSEFVLKESEERLMRVNENLELAEQQASLGNWEFEYGNQFTHWSKQMFRLFEMEPAEKAPSNEEFLALIHPDDRASITMYADHLLEQKEKENNVFRTNPEKVILKYLNPTWQVVKDERGNPVKYFGTLQDITEKVAAKEALRQREELFSKAFHSKVFGLAIVNQERRVIDINETLTSLIGYSREEMIGKTSAELGMTDPVYIKKRDELLLVLLQNGNIENYELEMIARHGKPLTLLLSVEPLSLNNYPHWLISLVDITEKRKAEQQLTESEQRLSRAELMGSLGHGYYNIKEGTMHLSEGLYKIFGVAPETFSHSIDGLRSVIHPDDFLIQQEAVETMFEKGEVQVEFRIVRPTGEVRNVLFKTMLTKNEKGELIDSFTTALCVTERKKAEEKLRASEVTRKLIMESAPDAIVGMDDIGVINVWTAQAEKTFGWKQNEVLGKKMSEVIIPEKYRVAHENGLKNYRLTGIGPVLNRLIELTAIHQNGKEFPAELSIVRYKQGDAEFFCAFIRDITESKKTEEQIKTNNTQLRQLAANLQNIREEERRRIGREIHDELGQLLTVLKMKIERVKDIKEDEKSLNESINEMLKQAEECINSSRKIATELRPAILDDLGLIAALEWQAEEFRKRTRIKTVFKTDLEELELPPGFTIAIFRIFQESLTNVARHAEATKVTSTLFVINGDIELKITDNGKGFDTSRIGATKSLGLIGMKERALLMSGTYTISSTPAKGTEITATIPLPVG